MENKNEHKVIPLYETYAVLDHSRENKKEHISMPSHNSVKEAKTWVDNNEL